MKVRATRLVGHGAGLGNLTKNIELNFTSENLDPRITFSRASNATYFDSTGTLQYAPNNLLTYSEQLDNSAWTKTRTTATANGVAAPDGTLTADKLVEDTSASTSHYTQSVIITPLSGTSYTGSVYIKAAERRYVAVTMTGGGGADRGVFFDTQTGTYTGGFAGGLPYAIENVGNGWYRFSVFDVTTAAASYALRVYVCDSVNNITYTGDGTSGVYVWGAQLNVGALQPYYSTTVKNLQGYTQEFNNAAWTKSAASVSADATAAPDGSFTADKLVEDGTNAGHYVTPAASNALTLNQIVTYSVYAKAAERTFIQLILTGISTASGNYVAGFDLSAGTAGTPTAGATASILAVGNGWYRCRLTVTVLTAATPTRQIRLALNANATASSYAGDGTSGAFIWGAQFSDSASLDQYFYNPVAAPTPGAYYGPRIEYDPATLALRGLLIEEARTNSLRNNTMVGAVAGTPGTAPTNWVVPGTINGLTQQIVGIGTENGITYIDIRYSGTTSVTGSHVVSFEAANQIAATSGQTWTRSAWFKIAAGSTANLTSLNHNTQGRNAANTAFTETFATDIAPSLTGTLTRFSTASTLADANTAFARSQIQYFYNSGVAIDLTLRIGLPQFEQGAFVTSVIPTSTTALTRSADVAAITGANFTNWFNSIEGTMVVSATVTSTTTDGTTRVLASIGDSSTFNETIYLARASSSANITANVIDGGVAQWASNTLGSATANTPFKTSMAYKLNDLGGSFNGAAAVTDSVATIPTVNSLSLGNGSWSGATNYINGYLQSFAYYRTRLPNSTLRALTS